MDTTPPSISNAALIADNADGLYLAVFDNKGTCIFLADFSGNVNEAGINFAELISGKATIEKVAFWWEEGDFTTDTAQLWDGIEIEEARARILNGYEWEDEDGAHQLAPLTAGGGGRYEFADFHAEAASQHGNISAAVSAARGYLSIR